MHKKINTKINNFQSEVDTSTKKVMSNADNLANSLKAKIANNKQLQQVSKQGRTKSRQKHNN